MTMREADEHAVRMTPVIYDGIEYRRIARTGFEYDDYGRRTGFVVLKDRNTNSYTQADPAKVTAKEGVFV